MLTVELRVLTGSLNTVPAVHVLFTHHRLEWMARSVGSYNKEMVREFYISYVHSLQVLLIGDRTLPNTPRSQIFKFEASGWTLTLLLSVAFNMVAPLTTRWTW